MYNPMTGTVGTAVPAGAVGTGATLMPATLLLVLLSAYTAVAQSLPPPPPIVPSGGYNGFLEQVCSVNQAAKQLALIT